MRGILLFFYLISFAVLSQNTSYQIGDNVQGGIVFYLDEEEGYGLVVGESSIGSYEYGCYGDLVSGADGDMVGDGFQNTLDIIASGCTSETNELTAAQACMEHVEGGFDDWYLPSKGELNMIYSNLVVNGLHGAIEIKWYKSSTELDMNNAFARRLSQGQAGAINKSTAHNVLPIRLFSIDVIEMGCTDELAHNYDSSANTDDGSCEYLGCTNELAYNYDSNVSIDDGTCVTNPQDACISFTPVATEYMSASEYEIVIQEFTSSYTLDGFVTTLMLESCKENGLVDAQLSLVTLPSMSVIESVIVSSDLIPARLGGCSTTNFGPVNFEFSSSMELGETYGLMLESFNGNGSISWQRSSTPTDPSNPYTGGDMYILEGMCEEMGMPSDECLYSNSNLDMQFSVCAIVYGCTDELAHNYDSSANTGDGSCEYLGCTDELAHNYDSLANTDDGSCEYLGCIDELACNFNTSATINDYSCAYTSWYIQAEIEELDGIIMYENNNETVNYEATEMPNLGLSLGSNFELYVNVESSDITFNANNIVAVVPAIVVLGNSSYDIEANVSVFNTENNDQINIEASIIQDGFVNDVHVQYNGVGALDNYSFEQGLPDLTLFGINSNQTHISSYFDDDELADQIYLDYDISASYEVSESTTSVSSCGLEYPEATNTFVEIFGCTDNLACNYVTGLLFNDGSCEYALEFYDCQSNCVNDMDADGVCDELEIIGCQNQLATNYNENATDNEGCLFSEEVFSSQQSAISLQQDSIQILNLELETQNSTLDSLTSVLEEAQENQETHSEVTRYIEIPEGWSMFGYTCADSVNVTDALGMHSSQIEIVKDEWGLAWLIEYNYNALGSLQYGQGYQIKTTEAIDDFQFCPNVE